MIRLWALTDRYANDLTKLGFSLANGDGVPEILVNANVAVIVVASDDHEGIISEDEMK